MIFNRKRDLMVGNGDFMETTLNSSFDWNGIRAPYVVATENDALNGVAMLFGHLLTGTAQIFSDVRTYWSPEAVQRVTGWKPEGAAKDGFIYRINSGATAMDGKPNMKAYWEILPEEAGDCLALPAGATPTSATSAAAATPRTPLPKAACP